MSLLTIAMAFVADIPSFYCLLRREYLYDLESGHGETVDCLVFAVDSVEGHAIGFDCMTDFGGQFARLPISAFCWKPDAPVQPLDHLELWNNFSYDVEAHEYKALRHLKCDALLKDRKWYSARYMFTLSWLRSPWAEGAGEGGFKRAHILKLDNGNFAAQPNNRIRWYEPSAVTKKFPDRPDFLTNSHIWLAETADKWATEDTDRYFYEDG
jgi:hypothetical protein